MNISTTYNNFSFSMTNLSSPKVNKNNTDNQAQDSNNLKFNNPVANKTEDRLKNLNKQKEAIQEIITKLKETKVDPNLDAEARANLAKQTNAQIKELQDQIKQIDQNIKSMIKEEKEKEEPPKEETVDEQMVDIGSTLDKAKLQHSIKEQMENRTSILKTEIKLDRSRASSSGLSFDPGSKQAEVNHLESKITELDKSIGKNLNKVNKKLDDEVSKKTESSDNSSTNPNEVKSNDEEQKTDSTETNNYVKSLIKQYENNKETSNNDNTKTVDLVL